MFCSCQGILTGNQADTDLNSCCLSLSAPQLAGNVKTNPHIVSNVTISVSHLVVCMQASLSPIAAQQQEVDVIAFTPQPGRVASAPHTASMDNMFIANVLLPERSFPSRHRR